MRFKLSRQLLGWPIILSLCLLCTRSSGAAACSTSTWAPDGVGLKDHTVFLHKGVYYLASIYLSSQHYEDRFAYARSADLCTWEELSPILIERQPGTWDEFRIWAPFVIKEGQTYYLFYTGVTSDFTQSIMLATSTNPADPQSWQPQGLVLQPAHTGMVWPGRGAWSDARDPMVLRVGERYYLYYTGLDEAGGIVGLATADSLAGPWQDWGPVLTVPGTMLESPGVVAYQGWYYLYYTPTVDGSGPQVRVGPGPAGPWSEPRPLRPGWAHEIWTRTDGGWMTSYLTDYSVTLSPIVWDTPGSQPWPFIGEQVLRVWLPAVLRAP